MIDPAAATDRLLRYLRVPGITGEERAIAEAVRADLIALGVPETAIHFDRVNARIPVPTQTGNLIVNLPGTAGRPKLMFSTHLDTVPLCAGAEPRIDGDKVVGNGSTALGGDDRTGVAVLVTLVEALLKHKPDHPPVVLLFTVREESGLYGARYLDPAGLGEVAMGFNVDGRQPSHLTVGAVGADRWEVEIFGKAAHAGVHPERGISAPMVASLALAEVFAKGYFGRVTQGNHPGTSNVGPISNGKGGPVGDATNVVTDYLHLKGESRSHDAATSARITTAYREAFDSAARQVTDHEGDCARVIFKSQIDYHPFRIPDDSPAVRHAVAAASAMGLSPEIRVTDGGLDANWLVHHGIPTVTIGAGQHDIHTVTEWIDLEEFRQGCRLAYQLATFG